ncbi:MAG TPA: hypothetical protein VGC42_26765 [Kofleriaceae bacterium]
MIRLALVAAWLAPALAHADATDRCIAESEQGQRLVLQRKFVEAEPHLVACGRAGCPVAVGRDCIERLKQAEASAASVVLAARRGDGDAPGARVAIDDRAAEPVSGDAVWIDPGPHRFRFEAGGARVVRDVTVEEGARLVRIAVSFDAPDAAPPSRRPLAVTLGAVGLAGVAGGLVFGLVASARQSHEQAACPSATDCPDRAAAQRDYDSARHFATASTLALLAGGALIATGAVLWLTSPPRRPGLALAPGVGGLIVRGAF